MRRRLCVAGLFALGCSTVARPQPFTGCESDEDCSEDEVCSVDQGGVCLRLEGPPRRVLAFEITESAANFGAEILACDGAPLIRFNDDTLLLEVDRDDLVQQLVLGVTDERVGPDCNPFGGCCKEGLLGCDGNYTCVEATDPDDSICEAPLSSTLQLRQGSRLGLGTRQSALTSFPLLDEEQQPLPDPEVTLPWPDYGSLEVPPTTLDVVPTNVERAKYRRMLVGASEDGEQTLDAGGTFQCHRKLVGTVRRQDGAPVPEAGITFRFAESIATASTLLGASPPVPCEQAEDCSQGLACEPDTGACGLDLSGSTAGQGAAGEDGTFSAHVYTYCEDGGVSERRLAATVTPAPASGLPQMTFEFDQTLPPPTNIPGLVPPDQIPDASLAGDLCLPDWPEPSGVSFEIGAAPVTLLTTEDGDSWRCCDTKCLPGGKVLGEPPPPPDVCLEYDKLTISTPLAPPDPDEWEQSGCLPFVVGLDASAGAFTRTVVQADDCQAAACSVLLPPPTEGGDTRAFEVAIEFPQTSLFSSRIYPVDVDPFTGKMAPIDFKPRTILKGEIVCADDTANCTAAEAMVVAERLRMPDEGGPLGPYLYYQVAYATSESAEGEPLGAKFALPLNPGVYVVTALPGTTSGGGPANFSIVDVRNDAPGVTEGLVRVLELDEPLELEAGLAVRLQLEDFDRGATVKPIDIGSWAAQEGFLLPGTETVPDLNDAAACYGSSPGVGCQIRQLTRQDAPNLSQLQSGRVQFTARDRGAKGCPQG